MAESYKNIAKTRDEAISRKPNRCKECESVKISFLDEMGDAVVFICEDCGKKIPIPYGTEEIQFFKF